MFGKCRESVGNVGNLWEMSEMFGNSRSVFKLSKMCGDCRKFVGTVGSVWELSEVCGNCLRVVCKLCKNI